LSTEAKTEIDAAGTGLELEGAAQKISLPPRVPSCFALLSSFEVLLKQSREFSFRLFARHA
jgi:hypothetical protein